MSGTAPRPSIHRAARRIIAGTPEDIAGMVFGAIMMLAVITAGSARGTPEPWRLALLVAGTMVVFWVGHVYAHALGESVGLGRRLDWSEFRSVARRQAAILLAGVAPCAALCLGGLGLLSIRAAVWVAIALGVATLGAQGLRYARLEHLGRLATAVSVCANLLIGLAIVALKLVVSH